MTDASPPLLALVFGCTLCLGLFLTKTMVLVGPKLGLMDQPDGRRVHLTPIPRAGGIAIWLSFLASAWGLFLFFPEDFQSAHRRYLSAFSIASALLMVIGVIDDWRGMRASVKLGGQILAACLFFWLEPSLHESIPYFGKAPTLVAAVVFIAWCVLLINAFNLIDGLDGLCSGLVLVALCTLGALGLFRGSTAEAMMVFVMMAAVLGFYRYNLNPAQIFLGDAGSMTLGFFLATSATQLGGKWTIAEAMMLPLAIAGVPLLDVLLAVWRRSIRKKLNLARGEKVAQSIFAPDRDHLHHRYLDRGMKHSHVALLLQVFALLVATLCLFPIILGGRALVITATGFFILALIGLQHFARIELVQSGSILHHVIKRQERRRSTAVMQYSYDVIALTLAGWVGMIMETNYGFRNETGVWSLEFLFLFVLSGIVVLKLLRTYHRVWGRATLREFFVVAASLTLGGLVTSSLWSFSNQDVTWSDFRCGFVASQFSIWLILLPRAIPEAIRELALDSRHRKFADTGENRQQVLVYGAGTCGNLFIGNLKSCEPGEFSHLRVVGFIDDNPVLRRRLLQGFRIFGGLDCLAELIKKHPIDGIIVAITEQNPEVLKKVSRVATKLNLQVYEWKVDPLPRSISREGQFDPTSSTSSVIGSDDCCAQANHQTAAKSQGPDTHH